MNKIQLLLISTVLGLMISCSDSGTTSKPTDLDRTDNDDTTPVMLDSARQPLPHDSVLKDSSATKQ